MLSSLKKWFGRQAPPSVVIDEQGVSVTAGDGKVEQVAWHELQAIDIVTTDEGPFVEDVFWVLHAEGHGCVVPGQFGNALLDHANHFPGWNTEAVLAAMGSTDNARFEVWRKPDDRAY